MQEHGLRHLSAVLGPEVQMRVLSSDQRHFAYLPQAEIKGRAFVIHYGHWVSRLL